MIRYAPQRRAWASHLIFFIQFQRLDQVQKIYSSLQVFFSLFFKADIFLFYLFCFFCFFLWFDSIRLALYSFFFFNITIYHFLNNLSNYKYFSISPLMIFNLSNFVLVLLIAIFFLNHFFFYNFILLRFFLSNFIFILFFFCYFFVLLQVFFINIF